MYSNDPNQQNNFHNFDNDYQQPYANQGNMAGTTMARYAAKTFGWMFLGLMVTFACSMISIYSGLLAMMINNMLLFFGLAIVEMILVGTLSVRLHSMSVGGARACFFGYAALNGVTFSVMFVAYASTDVVFAFLLTSLYFGALALFGYMTNADLTKMGPFLIGGIVFLLISNLALIFFDFPAFERMVCLFGIGIFLALTAYDTQKIKKNYMMYQQDAAMLGKASIYAALQLYLDFINLFIYLLRFMGKRNN